MDRWMAGRNREEWRSACKAIAIKRRASSASSGFYVFNGLPGWIRALCTRVLRALPIPKEIFKGFFSIDVVRMKSIPNEFA